MTTSPPTTSSMPSNDALTSEPTDEYCQTVAMLTDLYYNPTFRYNGQRCVYRRHWRRGDGRNSPRYVEYIDPVTLEVMGEQSISDHYLAISGVRP